MDKPALISLTFDDGFRCQFDQALPILDHHGIPATFFLIANRQPIHEIENHKNEWWKIDWRDEDILMLRKAIQGGHEVGSHSVTHDGRKMPTQPEFEARESKKLIEGWLGREISSFCYPFYRSHVYLADAVKNAGYAQARAGAGASYYASHDTLDWLKLDCRQAAENHNVKEWIRPGCWHILTFHGIGDRRSGWEPISVDRFTAMVSELAGYRDSNAVDIATFEQGAQRFRRHNDRP
jgi:peptidoglycan/xylan/chitin deacetylase (PgdA/CDA1 family)